MVMGQLNTLIYGLYNNLLLRILPQTGSQFLVYRKKMTQFGKPVKEEQIVVQKQSCLMVIKKCSLFCTSGEEVFSDFIYNVVPEYQERVSAGERWIVDKTTIQIEPAGQIKETGGTWRLSAKIQSNVSGDINVIAFVKVARNMSSYPQTLGYYIADFNAYKIN